jgi:hypothetical protein
VGEARHRGAQGLGGRESAAGSRWTDEGERQSAPATAPNGALDAETYKVVFEITRDGNTWPAAVWIKVGAVPTVDLIRVAMSLLHLTLKQLAAQTEAWRMIAQ